MTNIYNTNGKFIGIYDETNGIITTKRSIENHIYHKLHSFCFATNLLETHEWTKLLVETDTLRFEIHKCDFENFKKAYNTFISYGIERQNAIPLSMFTSFDNETQETVKRGMTILEFNELLLSGNQKYYNWGIRRNK